MRQPRPWPGSHASPAGSHVRGPVAGCGGGGDADGGVPARAWRSTRTRPSGTSVLAGWDAGVRRFVVRSADAARQRGRALPGPARSGSPTPDVLRGGCTRGPGGRAGARDGAVVGAAADPARAVVLVEPVVGPDSDRRAGLGAGHAGGHGLASTITARRRNGRLRRRSHPSAARRALDVGRPAGDAVRHGGAGGGRRRRSPGAAAATAGHPDSGSGTEATRGGASGSLRPSSSHPGSTWPGCWPSAAGHGYGPQSRGLPAPRWPGSCCSGRARRPG